MSNAITRFITWIILLAVLVAVLGSARQEMVPGGAAYDMIVAVFSDFPFAQPMAEIVTNMMQYNITLQGLAPAFFISDVAKVFAMCIVCPLVVGLATRICLPVPDYNDWYDREQYMKRPGYRLKEALLTVIVMPITAWCASKLVGVTELWLIDRLDFLSPTLVRIANLVLLMVISTLFLWIRGGFDLGLVVRHRLVDDLLGNVLKILMLNLLCFFATLSFMNDRNGQGLMFIVLMYIYVAALGMMLDALKG